MDKGDHQKQDFGARDVLDLFSSLVVGCCQDEESGFDFLALMSLEKASFESSQEARPTVFSLR